MGRRRKALPTGTVLRGKLSDHSLYVPTRRRFHSRAYVKAFAGASISSKHIARINIRNINGERLSYEILAINNDKFII